MSPPTSLASPFRYRPEIDGLRGIAVAVVVLYHAQLGMPGGYIGVDVFFVISGYLITSIILRDLETGRFSFRNFWERRIRRILPVLTVAMLVSLVAAWWIQLPDDYRATGESAAWQAVFAGNVYFWQHTGYFGRDAHEMVLLHTWSLSVEEQFYLLAPAGLAMLYALRFRRRRLLAAIGIGVVGSLWFSARRVVGDPADAFYLLPARAWELGLGSALALVPTVRLSPAVANLLCLTGLAGVLVPCFLYSSQTVFPGPAALPPCLGTALVIVGAASLRESAASTRLPLVARGLAWSPLVGIGLISYSFYLWHWPALVFAQYLRLDGSTPIGLRIGLVAGSLVLSIASWRWIEQPFRHGPLLKSRRRVWAFGVVCVLATGTSGLLIHWQQGWPGRFSAEVQALDAARNDRAFIREMPASEIVAGRLLPIGSDEPTAPPALVVWGDSHAMAVVPAFDAWLRENGRSGWQATRSVTPPLLGYGSGARQRSFAEGVISFVAQHRVPVTVLAAHWSRYSANRDGDPREALLKTIAALRPSGTRVWVVAQMPEPGFQVPRVLALARYRGIDYSHLLTVPDGNPGLIDADPTWLDRLRASGARILDARPLFVDMSGRNAVERDGVVLYRDGNHLSAAGARYILIPLLRRSIELD